MWWGLWVSCRNCRWVGYIGVEEEEGEEEKHQDEDHR